MTSCDMVAGWGAGTVGYAVGYPIDTIKVQQQVHNKPTSSVVNGVYNIQGIKGFFRGISFPLLTCCTVTSTFFGTYAFSLSQLQLLREFRYWSKVKHENGPNKDDPLPYESTYLSKCVDHGIAGAFGGMAYSCILSPVEVIKVRMQSEAQVQSDANKCKGPLNCMRRILKSNGIRGFYRGGAPYIFVAMLSSGVYTLTYFIVKSELDTPQTNIFEKTFRPFIAGGIAGVCSALSIHPVDAIRVRMQSDCIGPWKYRNARACAKIIYSEKRFIGFFRGSLAVSLWAFPVHGCVFLAYELFKNACMNTKVRS